MSTRSSTTVLRIAPTFGGIHLEDISAPECFEIERRLIEALPQPVMHDDVHGTAVVSLAAAMVACRYAGVELASATVGQLGLGAAGYGIASLMVEGGVKRVIAFDPLEAVPRAGRGRTGSRSRPWSRSWHRPTWWWRRPAGRA